MNGQSFFLLKVYAEDGVFYEGECHELILPCVDGEKAFMAHHEDAVYAVYNGIMRFLVPAEKEISDHETSTVKELTGAVWRDAVIGNGVAHFAKNVCVVLAETAERPEDIDENRARRALERARQKMQRDVSMREYRISQMAMARATARIRAAKKKETESI